MNKNHGLTWEQLIDGLSPMMINLKSIIVLGDRQLSIPIQLKLYLSIGGYLVDNILNLIIGRSYKN